MADVPPGWMDDAACVGMDTDVFFPADGDTGPAVAICGTCPVRLPCLDLAIAEGHRAGIWGGMTDKERRDYARDAA